MRARVPESTPKSALLGLGVMLLVGGCEAVSQASPPAPRAASLCAAPPCPPWEAVAASPVQQQRAVEVRAEVEPLEHGAQLVLDMRELSVVDEALEPATEEVAPFAPSWQMPAHEPGELPRWIRHQTLPGDTIAEIALRYGVRPESVREWNALAADEEPHPWRPDELRVHARVYPPPRERIEHEVVAGDTWGSIARRYGVDYRRLRKWNVSEIGRSLDLGERVQVWIDPIVFDSIVNDRPADARAALVRPGAHGVGPPQDGMLVAGVQIPPGERYELRYPKSAYGTTFAVRRTVAALDHFAASSDFPHPIKVGTMSRQRGGEIGGHVSHQTGRDLDIRLPLRAEVPQGLKPTMRRVDWLTTWKLVRAFATAAQVQVIFLDYGAQRRLYRAAKAAGASEAELDAMLQYPRGSMASLGLVRHSPGHEGHIHVRFPCGPAEPECEEG